MGHAVVDSHANEAHSPALVFALVLGASAAQAHTAFRGARLILSAAVAQLLGRGEVGVCGGVKKSHIPGRDTQGRQRETERERKRKLHRRLS